VNDLYRAAVEHYYQSRDCSMLFNERQARKLKVDI